MQSIGDYEYRPGELIGHGAFALVFKGQHKQTRLPVAIKQILLKNIPGKLSIARQEEISILKHLKHPNIVQLYHYHETSTEIYLIMEFCNGGDLAEYLQNMKTLSEESIRHLIKGIANALQVIHQRHIIHRDIKPQNLLLSYPQHKTSPQMNFQMATIKLADFGFARYLNGADMAATLCGSPLYMAPEILLGRRYDNKADLWSTGTILYQCLTGRAPFEASNPHALRRKYAKESLIPRIPEGVSPKLADLLLKLLKKNVQERLSHNSLISHPFLQPGSDDKVSLHEQSLTSLHAKSSPVPIKRRQSSNKSITSPFTSPLGSGSSGQKRFSPSSGPPLSHAIGSNIQSPPTKDFEDFVLVGNTGESSSRLSPSSHGSREGSSSQHSPSSASQSPSLSSHHYSSLCGPLSDIRSTPPSSLSPSSLRREMAPFSSLVKLGGGPQVIGSPASFQATPPQHSKSSSPVVKPSFSPGGGGGGSQRSSRQNSFTKLAVLFEQKDGPQTPPISSAALMCDSTELISQSLLMGSDILQKGFDNLLSNKIQSSPENLFRQLKEGAGKEEELVTRQEECSGSEFGDNDSLFSLRQGSLEPRPLDEGPSEEMFSLQLEEDFNSTKGLAALRFSVSIAHELLKLAKSRQGPMLLLSSSMGDSGRVLDHAQRFSEQLVLCVKAAKVIEDGFKEYEIELAACSMDPQEKHRIVLDEAQALQRQCLEKGQIARELYSKCVTKRRQSFPQTTVIAEKLIFWQAVDMCKQAVLEENTLQKDEILRRYHHSLLLFQLLSSDAKTEGDRNTIKRYETSIRERLKTVSQSF